MVHAPATCRISSAGNVRELPRPITGMISPVDGIGLLINLSRLAALWQARGQWQKEQQAFSSIDVGRSGQEKPSLL
jgi:hypothetical protein